MQNNSTSYMEGQVQKIMMQLNYSHLFVFLNFDVLGNKS